MTINGFIAARNLVLNTDKFYKWLFMVVNAYRILVEKPEGKRPLGRSRARWVVKVKVKLSPCLTN
jgi:hypothetical protein